MKKEKIDMGLEMSEEQLLDAFFAEARQPIADDGFTERVMSALPARSVAYSLRRYSFWLNFLGGVGIAALLIYLGFFTRTWAFLHELMMRIVVGTITFDFDGLLVQFMLFLHRLPELLPPLPQLTAIVITTIVFMTMCIERVVKKATTI